MWHKAWNSKGKMPFLFSKITIKFQGHTVQNITDFDPNWAFPDCRPVAAFKSLRFALFNLNFVISIMIWNIVIYFLTYNTIWYNLVLLITWQCQVQDRDQNINSQRTLHTLPSQMTYGVSFVSIVESLEDFEKKILCFKEVQLYICLVY